MKSDVYLASPVTMRGPSMRGVSRPIGEAAGDGCVVVDIFAPVIWVQLAVAVRKACMRQRFANSILNLFSLCGLALWSAASAAWRKEASFAGLPVSAPSAS